jgi:asparagine synthase (glutamine-hydrolysing)
MCGIVGFIDAGVSKETSWGRLVGMTDLIVHRGPDGRGLFQDAAAGLALGMRRLSIIDLAGGDQPIWNETGTVGVVFNGEIYNYIELRDELERRGHQFKTHSDTEVLVHGYEEYGRSLLSKLRGMFAFATYDRAKRRLFLARDHFGQKPLYYCVQGNRFAFASEIKALLHLPWVPREFDEEAFLDYVSWHSTAAPQTHYRSICKFPAAPCMDIDLASPSFKFERYWDYPAKTSNGAAKITDMAEAVDALERVFADSVRIHLRADVPVGILLSGGLDSRSVATFAVEAGLRELQSFTVGYDEPGSEHLEAEKTAKQLGTRHHTVLVTAEDFAANLETVAWHLDDPVADPAAFAVLTVCRYANRHVKVLLGGEGSDELLGGYAGRYKGMMETIGRSNGYRWLSTLSPRQGWAFPTTRWGRFWQRVHSTQGRDIVALRMEGFPGDVRDPAGLTTAQLDRLSTRSEELAKRFYRPMGDMLAEMTSVDVGWQLADSLLLKADKMSMAASIELRCPFLDREVADVAARIDSKLKLSPDGRGKLPLRHCMERRFPGELNRPKQGFPMPLAKWFLGPLHEPLREAVFRRGAAWREFLDGGRIESAWNAFASGRHELAVSFYALWLYEAWRDAVKPLAVAA